MKSVGTAVGSAAVTGYQYGQDKYQLHKSKKDTDLLKTECIDKLDGISQDIVLKSEQTLRSLIEIQTKLENDKIMIEDSSLEIKD